MTPAVSVVMAIRKHEPYLAEARKSVAAQTFTDFEMLEMDGERGLTVALNSGVRASRAPFIARMDADDV